MWSVLRNQPDTTMECFQWFLYSTLIFFCTLIFLVFSTLCWWTVPTTPCSRSHLQARSAFLEDLLQGTNRQPIIFRLSLVPTATLHEVLPTEIEVSTLLSLPKTLAEIFAELPVRGGNNTLSPPETLGCFNCFYGKTLGIYKFVELQGGP